MKTNNIQIQQSDTGQRQLSSAGAGRGVGSDLTEDGPGGASEYNEESVVGQYDDDDEEADRIYDAIEWTYDMERESS